ncbi:U2 snRNP component prp10, partial [Coemansia sp. RSA 2673]
HGLEDENQPVRTTTALALAALAEAAAPYGIESFDTVLKPLWTGIRKHRGKGLAAFLKAIGFIIPLMEVEYANHYTREVMVVETTVELAGKVGGAEVISRIVLDLKDESGAYRNMVMETITRIVSSLGGMDIEGRLEELLMDGVLYAFQEQAGEGTVMLDGFGVGTLVIMADGTSRPIESVVAGDCVASPRVAGSGSSVVADPAMRCTRVLDNG